MTRTLPRVVAPTFETRRGRTWLTYPDFYPGPGLRVGDTAGAANQVHTPDPLAPGLVLGVVVFRDTSFDSDRRSWLERAKAVVEEVVGPDRVLVPWQVHSARVCDVEELVDGEECDGLVTGIPGVMVGVTVADCVPLLAVNEKARVVGAAHCGWRGTAAGIVEKFGDALEGLDGPGAHGDDRDATRYLIGPSIGRCCYEVGRDMLSRFTDRERETCVSRRTGGAGRKGRTFFDLKAAVIGRLADRGVAPEQIYVDNTCTSCQQSVLSSYRAGGRDCGRMLAFLMLTR